MLSLKEYKNKKLELKKEKINPLLIFDVNDSLLVSYFEFYSIKLFKDNFGGLNLKVLPKQKDDLEKLKGVGSWVFGGLRDYGFRGAIHCEKGHSLRYAYKAINIENKEEVLFGVNCIDDFFEMSDKDIKKLLKFRNLVYEDLLMMALIKNHNLLTEYSYYDYDLLGVLWRNFGKKGIEDVFKDILEYEYILGFLEKNIPLPTYLIEVSRKHSLEIQEYLQNVDHWGIDKNVLEELKNSKISLISNMFSFSEGDIKNLYTNYLLKDKITSDFYNFLNISDLSVAMSIWVNRNRNLLKVHHYFKEKFKNLSWFTLYRYVIEVQEFKSRENMYSLELLMLFDTDITLNFTINPPHNYKYKGYSLNRNIEEVFDTLIDYMGSRSFYQFIQNYYELEMQSIQKEQNEKERIENIIEYMLENINDDKYNEIKGIGGVRDILLQKKIPYIKMTVKQRNYVLGIYDLMQELDKGKKNNICDSIGINNRYSLMEKPDVLIKIERLQNEVFDKLSEFYKGIILNVLSNHIVTDRQLIQIDKMYTKYILNQSSTVSIEQKSFATEKNRKYSLIERPDISEKIRMIKASSEYFNIPLEVRTIFDNIIKYGMVSEKQAKTVENTYKRHMK